MRATRPHSRAYPELESVRSSAHDLLLDRVAVDGDGLAIVDGVRHLTWSDLGSEVRAARHRLESAGTEPGSVVVLQLPNWWEAIAYAHAAWALEAVLTPVTPIYREEELATIFAMAKPTVIVAPQEFRGRDFVAMSREACAMAGVPAMVLPTGDERERDGDPRPAAAADSRDSGPADRGRGTRGSGLDDISLLMFTSGTTGRPKGVLHSQRTLLYEAGSIAGRFGLSGQRIFMPSPLSHITGLLYGILLPLLMDGSVVLQDRWDAHRARLLIEGNSCGFCVGATPFLAGLAREYEGEGEGSALEWFVCGGADVPAHLGEQARVSMGTRVARAYGLTELPTLSCGAPGDGVEELVGTDGSLIGSSEARLVDVVDGVGELEAHGPEMFLGYLDPADNESAFTPDGWFRTGDLARFDDGRITIAGRAKDIIVRGGENIAAKEVEDLIGRMPSVQAVAIVGVADDELGERACAVVVAPDDPPSLEQVIDYLSGFRIARQKLPEYLVILDALPMTASGKIQKYRLRTLAGDAVRSGQAQAAPGVRPSGRD